MPPHLTRPPDSFWRDVPCGHPQDPLAWWDGEKWICHCGMIVNEAVVEVNVGFPVVSCSKCGCYVGCKPPEPDSSTSPQSSPHDPPEVEVAIRIRINKLKLSEYVRQMYEEEEVPGEPEPWRDLLPDWIAEMQGAIDSPTYTSIDTLWFESSNDYVESITVEMQDVPDLEAVKEAGEAERKLGADLMENYRGKWVALRDHRVVASADTLEELRTVVNLDEVESVMLVPPTADVPWFFNT